MMFLVTLTRTGEFQGCFFASPFKCGNSGYRVARDIIESSTKNDVWTSGDTVDGRNPAPVDVLSHYLQGSLHPRWCRIPSINSIFT